MFRGKDLNLRSLGYELNTWFWMDRVVAKNQSHTVSMYLIISTVSGSPVSNLLALLRSQPTRLNPIIAVRAPGRFKTLAHQVSGLPVHRACDSTTVLDTFQQP